VDLVVAIWEAAEVAGMLLAGLLSPSQVRTLLVLAHSRRSIAATPANESSLRSHSIFILRISGVHVDISNELVAHH
jgi:kinesin family protein C1